MGNMTTKALDLSIEYGEFNDIFDRKHATEPGPRRDGLEFFIHVINLEKESFVVHFKDVCPYGIPLLVIDY